jgi:hypothetical protein
MKGTYRFERVSAAGAITVLKQGTWAAPLVETQQLTINATYNVATLPNTAMAPKAQRPMAVLPALGMLTLLIAAALLAGSAARKRPLRLPERARNDKRPVTPDSWPFTRAGVHGGRRPSSTQCVASQRKNRDLPPRLACPGLRPNYLTSARRQA